jgi:Asp-tRNA(Asn)/Glu-tRNA(Gln) amidotransferase A subunit family amidase
VPFALAADAGGSVRLPAALCGAVGLMPSMTRHTFSGARLVNTCSVAGPIATTASDALLVYAVMADAGADALRLPRSLGRAGGALRGLRVGVYEAWNADCDADVAEAVQRTVGHLRALGALHYR